MKKAIKFLVIVLLSYLFIFYMSRNSKKEYILGTGWKYYVIENYRIEKNVLIGELEKNDSIFFKRVKFYPKITGLLSYDLKKIITSIDIDKPFVKEVSLISQNRKGNIFVKIGYEIIKGKAINYIFNLPVRIENIEIEKPVELIETFIE